MSLVEPIADSNRQRRPHDAASAAAWLALVVLPMPGLVMLLAAPATDVHWEHHPPTSGSCCRAP